MNRVILAAIAVLCAVPLLAQRYDDTITVNVVDVPVYVERFGRPITNLTRDDFELYVNDEPHPIEYFDIVDEIVAVPEAAAERAAPVDLKRRRLIVLLFDVGASFPHSLQRARTAATRYVEHGAPGDTFAVATVSQSGVLFIVPFTTDRVAVRRAIATLRPSAARDPFRVATLGVERDLWGDGHPGFQPPAIAGWHVGASIDMSAVQNDFSSRSLIENLTHLADRLAALEGLKEVVLLSEGRSDPYGPFTGAGTMHAKTLLHKRYREAGVVLNAVDIRTPGAPGGNAMIREGRPDLSMPKLLTSDFLWSLALDTGGIATSSMPELQKRSRIAYVIGFRPPPSKSSSNSIRVYVKNVPFLTDVRYRKAYAVEREPMIEGLFLADTLLNDIPQNGVTLEVEVHDSTMAARIPGIELLSYASPTEPRLRLDVYFYVFDTRQRPVAWNRMEIAVDLEKGREFLNTNPYTMSRAFDLDPGRYIAKALVRVAGTDRVGFARAEFEVTQ